MIELIQRQDIQDSSQERGNNHITRLGLFVAPLSFLIYPVVRLSASNQRKISGGRLLPPLRQDILQLRIQHTLILSQRSSHRLLSWLAGPLRLLRQDILHLACTAHADLNIRLFSPACPWLAGLLRPVPANQGTRLPRKCLLFTYSICTAVFSDAVFTGAESAQNSILDSACKHLASSHCHRLSCRQEDR